MGKYRAKREYGYNPIDSYTKTTNDSRYGRPEPPYIPVQHDRPQWQGRQRKIEYDVKPPDNNDTIEQLQQELKKRDEKIAKLESDVEWWDIYSEEFGKHYGEAIQRWNAEHRQFDVDDDSDDWVETVDIRHQEAQAEKENQYTDKFELREPADLENFLDWLGDKTGKSKDELLTELLEDEGSEGQELIAQEPGSETNGPKEIEKFAGRNIYEMSLEELRELSSYGRSELVQQRLEELEPQPDVKTYTELVESKPEQTDVEIPTDVMELMRDIEPETIEHKEKLERDSREYY